MKPINESDHYIPGTVNAAVGDDFKTEQPIRISFEPYGSPLKIKADDDHFKPGYKCIDGYIKGKKGYAHIRGINGEWYILTSGDEFAPSQEDWFGKEVVEKFDADEQDELLTPPLADEDLVLGKRAEDGNGYIPIGINPVILFPTDESGEIISSHNSSLIVNKAMKELDGYEDMNKTEAKKAINKSIYKLQKAKNYLDGEYGNGQQPPTK
jgi:hypothetical protein